MKKRTMWMISALILTFAQPVFAVENSMTNTSAKGVFCEKNRAKAVIKSADAQDGKKKIETTTAASSAS